MQRSKSIIGIILFYIVLYIYIYNPAIRLLSLASLRLLYPFMLLWLLRYSSNVKRMLDFYKKDFIYFVLLILFTFFYSVVGGDAIFFKNTLLLLLDGYVLGLFIVFINNRCFPNITIDQSLYTVSCIAALISLILFLSPGLNEFVRNNFSLEDTDRRYFLYRCFGFASGLTFDYGIIQGLALVYCIHFRRSVISRLLIPVFLLSVLFNARTGIIMPILYVVYNSIFKFKIKYWFLIIIIVCCVVALFNSEYYYEYENTLIWIMEGFYEISDSVLGTDLATFNTLETLSENHLVFPKTFFDWLFGTGVNLYTATDIRSDSGYIIQLNYGGLLFLSLIIGLLLHTVYNIKKYCNKNVFYMITFVLLTIVVCNYKGTLYSSNSVLRLYFLLYVYFTSCAVYQHRNLNESLIDVK